MAFAGAFGRKEEKRAKKRLVIALVGSVLLIIFVVLFGFNLLVGFSVLVDKFRGGPATPTPSIQQAYVTPPTIDSLPEATNSASLVVSGRGSSGSTLILYLNDVEEKKLTISENGNYSVHNLPFREGVNVISAKQIDEQGNASELSNIVSVVVNKTPPTLDLFAPEANATITGETNTVGVSGKTDQDCTVTINGRLAVISADNTFSHQYPLNEGENILKIVSQDRAGNQTIIERRVMYQK